MFYFGIDRFIPHISAAIQSDRLSAIKRYNNAVDGYQGLITIAIIFVALVAVFIVLRIIVKVQQSRGDKKRPDKRKSPD